MESIEYEDLVVYPYEGLVKHKIIDRFEKNCCSHGYNQFYYKGKMYLSHRFIFEKFHNVLLTRNQEINHIDNNRSNNKITNLELVSSSQNKQWKGCQSNNFLKLKNIYIREYGSYRVEIHLNKKKIANKSFKDLFEAIDYRNKKYIEINILYNCKFKAQDVNEDLRNAYQYLKNKHFNY